MLRQRGAFAALPLRRSDSIMALILLSLPWQLREPAWEIAFVDSGGVWKWIWEALLGPDSDMFPTPAR